MILVGHGAAARDCPRELVSRLKALEGARRARGAPSPSDEERELDRRVRAWPRTPENDPYGAGLERLRAALAARLPAARVVSAFNELASPSLDDAARAAIADGARAIFVVSSMPTPGGIHAEEEIPETLAALREEYPEVDIRYAWPFEPGAVAELFASALAASGLA